MKGSLEWEQHNPDYVRYTPKGGAPQILSRGDGYITEELGSCSRIPVGHPEGLFVAFANIYRDFTSALIKKKNGEDIGRCYYPTIEDGVNGVKFVHAVVNSAKNNSSWQEIN